MSPIPGKGHDEKPQELTTNDGRKVRLRIPGMQEPVRPDSTAQRGEQEPPREDPRPPHDPLHGGI